ncbi:MAG: LamG-like jellyroll fold domain-containing protein [Pseudomonadota bacterium]
MHYPLILLVAALSSMPLTNAQTVTLDWSARAQVGSRSTGVVGAADINADGIADVAVAINNAFVWYPGPDYLADDESRIGDGSGTSYGGTLADMNGDGWPDLVVSDGARNAGPGRLWVFLHPGNTADIYEPWTRIEVWSEDVWHQNDLVVADLDGDSRQDIAVRTRADARRVIIALQNDDFTSWTVRTWPTGETNNAPEGLGVGDVDNDGEAELVLSGVYWDNPGGWRTGDPVEYDIDDAFVGKAVKARVADLDQDGQSDDIAMSKAEGSGDIYLAWYKLTGDPADGTTAWTRTLLLDGVSAMHTLETADLNQDGHVDVLAANSFGQSGVYAFYGADNGDTWTEQVIDASGKMYVAALADLDGDSDLDVVGPAVWQGQVFRYMNGLFTNGGPTDPPGAPTGLAAVTVSDTAIALSWQDNADNETRHVIERRTTAQGAFADVAVLGANVTSYQDNTLAPSTSYDYRVRAENAAGISDPSNEATAVTNDPPPPDTEAPSIPGAPLADTVRYNQVDLSWAAAMDNVGVTGYRVLLNGVEVATAPGTSASVGGLAPLTGYDVALTAFDAAGNESAPGDTLSFVTPDAPSLADALIAHYRLDETEGLPVSDATGQHPGQRRGNAQWAPGQGVFGGALDLSGGDDAVDIAAFDVTGESLTLAAWLYVDSVSGIADEGRVISKASGVGEQDHIWMLGIYLDGSALRFRLKTDTGGTTTLISDTGLVPLQRWVHVAATYDGSAMRLYVDGTVAASTGKTGMIATAADTPVALGNQPEGLTYRGLIGQLDEVAVLDAALDTEQLALLMAGLPSGADSDGDGIADALDNCTAQANAAQTDADGDGYGNACDADLNNDCVVNVVDLGRLRVVFFTNDPVADLNVDGVVNVVDLGLLREQFFAPPGPAANGSCPP